MKTAALFSALMLCCGFLFSFDADARTYTEYRCLAQDTTWSYDAYAPTKNEAKAAAFARCRAESDVPRACYHHRCEKKVTKIPDPIPDHGGGSTPSQPNSCSFDSQCSYSEICEHGKCVAESPWNRRCHSDSQCSFDQLCESGRCVDKRNSSRACSSNISCSFNQVCVQGVCVDDWSFDNRCMSDFDCGTFGKCDAGKCSRN